jgi:DNA-binding response OmpR family regulator
MRRAMGRAIRPIAVVVEDDYFQCEQITEILEANEMQVIRCDTAEAAELVIARTGLEMFPNLAIVVVSGTRRDVPRGIAFLEKPWNPSELLRELPIAD